LGFKTFDVRKSLKAEQRSVVTSLISHQVVGRR
jgi:hypothetical protein